MKYIGIDNGVSGSIGIVDDLGRMHLYTPTPTIKCLNYTKTKAWITRINHESLTDLLSLFIEGTASEAKCAIERPMVNPGRFKATVSALRALESTQLALEALKIPYEFLDSKEWQKALLPHGLEKEELKIASNEVCKRKFPDVTLKHPGDGDGLLIAEYLRMKNHA